MSEPVIAPAKDLQRGVARPVIGLTPDAGETFARPGRPSLPRYELKQAYCDAVLAAGGLPVVLPYVDDMGAISSMVSLCQGLVVTGGAFDIPPELYGEAAHEKLGALNPVRTQFERLLMREALARGIPLLGVCGGMQLLAVELGGTLLQDIHAAQPDALEHEQRHDSREPAHAVLIEGGSLLARITGLRELSVNTTHHQAVAKPGRSRVSGRAPDGIVEAIEGPGRFTLGVQWHPELMSQSGPAGGAGGDWSEPQGAIYRALIRAAGGGEP